MNPDVCFALGIFLAVLSVPSLLSAIVDQRAPRVAAFTAVAAGCLIIYAFQTNPGVYNVQEIPHAFVRVAAMIL